MSSFENNPYTPPAAPLQPPSAEEGGFHVVGLRKMVILWLASFGLYSVYWFYLNWRHVRSMTGRGIHPLLGAIFNPLSSFWLFRHIARAAEPEAQHPTLNVNGYAATYLGLNFLSRLPDPWWMLALVALLPLLEVQKVVNQMRHTLPEDARNTRLTGANWAVIGIGSMLWLLVIAALMFPELTAEGA